MRTSCSLWKLVKKNFDKHFEFGLCNVLFGLQSERKITLEELNQLLSELDGMNNGDVYFLGEPRDRKPRLDYINERISLHRKEFLKRKISMFKCLILKKLLFK